jgi:hypothetical protein
MKPNKGLARRLTLAAVVVSSLVMSGCCVMGPYGGSVCFPWGPGGGDRGDWHYDGGRSDDRQGRRH